MAPYGGPIEPGIALGGYPRALHEGSKPDYRLSKGLVMTFLVNNHNDKSKLEPAMEWETKWPILIYHFEQ